MIIPAIETDAVSFLHELVATPSVSGDEARAVEVFVRAASALGLDAHIDAAGNAVAYRRGAAAPPDDRPTLALLGHIDTVPGWIPVRVENGTLWGRGSVDAKGPLAAMLFAAAYAQIPDDASIVVIGALGEETPRSPGAHFIRDRMRPGACIIGEPSGSDAVTLGYKGRLIVDAMCERDEGHSAGAEGSPCDAVLGWLGGVHERIDAMHAGRERVWERIQAVVLSMESASDGLLASARLRLGLRLPAWIGPDEMAARLRAPDESSVVTLRFDGHEHAHASPRDDAVVRALSRAVSERGARPRHLLKTGTSDMNVVAPAWRCPIAAYGPGDSALDHTPHERLELSEFRAALHVLCEACATITGEAAGVSADNASTSSSG